MRFVLERKKQQLNEVLEEEGAPCTRLDRRNFHSMNSLSAALIWNEAWKYVSFSNCFFLCCSHLCLQNFCYHSNEYSSHPLVIAWSPLLLLWLSLKINENYTKLYLNKKLFQAHGKSLFERGKTRSNSESIQFKFKSFKLASMNVHFDLRGVQLILKASTFIWKLLNLTWMAYADL